MSVDGQAQQQSTTAKPGLSLRELRFLTPTVSATSSAQPTFLIGSCSAGTPLSASGSPDPNGTRPIGDLSRYSRLIRIRKSDSGFVRARADAQWDVEELRNVLGYLPAGLEVWAEGPLKNADVSAGIGFAVPVRDLIGNTCRAYLSATVIEESMQSH